MPLGRVILAASEARVRGQASRNSSAINIAICLIEDQLQSNGPSHLFSGQSLTGAGRRSELSLLLRSEEHSFLKRVLARIWQYASGAGCYKWGLQGKRSCGRRLDFGMPYAGYGGRRGRLGWLLPMEMGRQRISSAFGQAQVGRPGDVRQSVERSFLMEMGLLDVCFALDLLPRPRCAGRIEICPASQEQRLCCPGYVKRPGV